MSNQVEQFPESDLITLTEAADLINVSKAKMSRLVASGYLHTEPDPLDERVKLVRRSDVVALRKRERAA
jgi:DNA-binding MarR family transcriptional regulator